MSGLPLRASEEGTGVGERAPAGASLAAALSSFEPIQLGELGAAALMERVDSKFIMPVGELPRLLEGLSGLYRMLEVNGARLGRYRTRYFDTPALTLYHDHHAGRLPRYKLRIRSYLESGAHYLEVKLKGASGRTHKTRVPLGPGEDSAERVRSLAAAQLSVPLPPGPLVESLVADFRRVTLVANEAAERLTVDVGLAFARAGRVRAFPAVAVIEVKQERQGGAHAREALRELSVRNEALSKYCLGIASLEPAAKKNRFRRVMARVGRIQGRPLALEG